MRISLTNSFINSTDIVPKPATCQGLGDIAGSQFLHPLPCFPSRREEEETSP